MGRKGNRNKDKVAGATLSECFRAKIEFLNIMMTLTKFTMTLTKFMMS